MQNGILTVCLTVAVAMASPTANADEWQNKLQSVIRQFDTNAVVAVESSAYVYRYHTQTFKIHTIMKAGGVSETAHDEEGPNVDGIFLKVSLQDGPYRGAAMIPQNLRQPYWTTFINAYPVSDGKYLWLSLSYGSRADKKLMESVKTCFGPILPPEPGTISQTLEKAQPFGTDPVPITNIVKAPGVLKGLYGTRRSRTNAPSMTSRTEAAVMKALRMFKANQNEDGSWGTEDKRRLATPLVLTALLGHGENASSPEFGDTVVRAHRYLLACTPTNDAEHITAIIALLEYVALHVGSTQRGAAKAEVAKIQASLSAVRRTADDPWVDYLTFFLLPQEVPRPAWLKYTHAFPKRWSDAKVNVEPGALDEYLALRVAGLAKFRIGGEAWSEFNRQFAPKMVERQTDTGFYPCQPETDQFACTALAVQAIEVYYAWQPHYYAQPDPEQQQKPGAEDVEVKIE